MLTMISRNGRERTVQNSARGTRTRRSILEIPGITPLFASFLFAFATKKLLGTRLLTDFLTYLLCHGSLLRTATMATRFFLIPHHNLIRKNENSTKTAFTICASKLRSSIPPTPQRTAEPKPIHESSPPNNLLYICKKEMITPPSLYAHNTK
ncbi:hypothetical protein HBI60_063470 [Parastagonospora nodorum]|nr:hypothetical protein HBI60_063470 [Parastagonospora nodorum]